ncbi:hypothetical protein [Methylobacter svalbardensis]|uniref:hypothetical protein n=1 Tax=Methylobacter svalbardensis TaxID=3080016 RepID=UPI0030EB580E
MNETKLIFCIVIGVLLANGITYAGYSYLTERNSTGLPKNIKISEKSQNNQSFNELKAPRVSVTIKNDSYNQLICEKIEENKAINFLTLDGKKERSYENIAEGEYIGCSIAIDNRSSTFLNWFHVTSSGVYTLLLEQVECKTCQGIDHTWGTIVITPNGERKYKPV